MISASPLLSAFDYINCEGKTVAASEIQKILSLLCYCIFSTVLYTLQTTLLTFMLQRLCRQVCDIKLQNKWREEFEHEIKSGFECNELNILHSLDNKMVELVVFHYIYKMLQERGNVLSLYSDMRLAEDYFLACLDHLMSFITHNTTQEHHLSTLSSHTHLQHACKAGNNGDI